MRIDDVVEDVYDGPHATPKKTEKGPWFLGISSLNNGRLELSESEHLSEEDFVKWTRRITPREGDLVFSYETRLGQAALIPEGLQCCLGRRMGLLRPDREVVDPHYLLYAFLGPEFQATLRAHSVHGSTVDRILLTELPNLPIRIHGDLEEQRRIASILGALDDKIELNRKMNRTLEEIAQTLFRTWFVDFEGRTDLVGTALEPSPPGWSVGSLDEVAELAKDTVKPQEEPDSEWLHFSIPAFDSARRPIAELGHEIKSNKYAVPSSGVLVSKLNPRLPRIWRIHGLKHPRPACSTEFLPLVPKKREWLPYLFELLRSEPVLSEIQRRATGTTGSRQRVKPKEIAHLPILRPPDDGLLTEFSDLVGPLHERVELNLTANATLADLRDTLLPKLISGEIRVPEAVEVVEDATDETIEESG